ncbi:MAG: minichromosome maintenance protein MCM [Candidatus Thermoplasmatota archaeon]
MALSIESLSNIWERLFSKYKGELADISRDYPDKKSITIPHEAIAKHNSELAEYLLTNPESVIYAGERTLKEITGYDVHLRITNIPKELARVPVRELRAEHLGKFIAVEGLMRRASEVRPRLKEAVFQCLRCNAIIRAPQGEELTFREPLECYKEQGGCGKSIATTRFKLLTDESKYVDTQKLELQESPEGLRGGEQPQRLVAYVEDDLVGKVLPGNRVILNGILDSTQKKERGIKSTLFDIFLRTNSIEIEEREFEEIAISEDEEQEIIKLSKDKMIYQKIVSSIAPSIHGMELEKEALALQLFGGLPKEMPDGTKIRGDIHILLVGDPGTAKSQLLRYISALAPRGIYTSGKGATGAGLTATAVRDEFEGRWTLEAGALVLGDKGIVCVDEIDKMAEHDRSAIHEAMEQQTTSIAKAGITATLHCRCALLGAANPKFGRFEEYKALAEQIELSPTLLSRFDLIFSVTDKPHAKKDAEMAEHILRLHHAGEIASYRVGKETGRYSKEDEELAVKAIEPEIDPEFMRKYIAYAKRTKPVMTKEAEETLKEYYITLRSQGEQEGAAVPITPRQLEAFVRLSEASARVRLSEEITREDAERAIKLMHYSLARMAYDKETERFDIDKIVTGITASQRGRLMNIFDIVRDLASKDLEGASYQDILAGAAKVGIAESKVEEVIDRLKREGRIYERRPGRYIIV